MLVDDDPDDRDIFCEVIHEIDKNIQCVVFPGCAKALTYLKKRSSSTPDFIFLDLNMPATNGMQCITKIKNLEPVRNKPVIIYSTSKNPLDLEAAKKKGVSFLSKQGHLSVLKADLRKVLRK